MGQKRHAQLGHPGRSLRSGFPRRNKFTSPNQDLPAAKVTRSVDAVRLPFGHLPLYRVFTCGVREASRLIGDYEVDARSG